MTLQSWEKPGPAAEALLHFGAWLVLMLALAYPLGVIGRSQPDLPPAVMVLVSGFLAAGAGIARSGWVRQFQGFGGHATAAVAAAQAILVASVLARQQGPSADLAAGLLAGGNLAAWGFGWALASASPGWTALVTGAGLILGSAGIGLAAEMANERPIAWVVAFWSVAVIYLAVVRLAETRRQAAREHVRFRANAGSWWMLESIILAALVFLGASLLPTAWKWLTRPQRPAPSPQVIAGWPNQRRTIGIRPPGLPGGGGGRIEHPGGAGISGPSQTGRGAGGIGLTGAGRTGEAAAPKQARRIPWWWLLLLLLMLAAAAVLLRRLLARLQRLLAAWLSRLKRRRPAPAPAGPEAQEEPLVDLFDHPELLSRMSPAQIVSHTFRLLTRYGEKLGRGRQDWESPLSYAGELARFSGIGETDLRGVCWAYCLAAYGSAEPDRSAVDQLRRHWLSVKQGITSRLTPGS